MNAIDPYFPPGTRTVLDEPYTDELPADECYDEDGRPESEYLRPRKTAEDYEEGNVRAIALTEFLNGHLRPGRTLEQVKADVRARRLGVRESA